MARLRIVALLFAGMAFPGSSARAAVGANVFAMGDFERGWVPPKHPNLSLAEADGNHFLRVTNDNAEHVQAAHLSVPVKPRWDAVKVSAKMRAVGLLRGKESWHNARLQLSFGGPDGKMVGKYGPVPRLDTDSEWTTRTVTQDVPKGAVTLRMSAGLWFSTGTMEIDDIRVVPIVHGPVAELPEGETLHWGKEPVEALSAKRGQICLNGLWRFVPAVGPAASDPKEGWGWTRVPGSWAGTYFLPGLVTRGRGDAWRGVDGRDLAKAWYERTVRVPAEWAGRAIVLDLARVSTDAVVFANRVECGRVAWPYGEVDITKAVKPGHDAAIRLLVVATAEEKEVDVFMGPNQVSKSKRGLAARGLIGDVLLRSRPQGAYVSDVFVRTSVRKQQLALEVELADVAQHEEIHVTARVLDGRGREAKVFKTMRKIIPAARRKYVFAWDWADPNLWDLGQANLYTVKLQIKGAGLDDEYAQRFGFREFWIEGRRFFLNGTEIRLRPFHCHDEKPIAGTRELIDAAIDGARWAGFNIQELWPWNHDERGAVHYRGLWCEAADAKGWPLMAPALSMSHLVGRWEEPGVKERWERRMDADLRRFRNHPSALMWATSANRFGHGDDQNPRRVGVKKGIDDTAWQRRAKAGEDAVATIKQHDPTRPVMVHQGGPVGDVYALNNYLCLIPLQEREEWLSHWAQHGDMPYMVVEFGTPLHCTFMRGRAGGGWGRGVGATYSEPLMTEFCAIYLGRDAYELERAEYRARMRERFVGGVKYKSWQGNGDLDRAPANQRLQYLFSRNTYRAWRTMGCTGGMIPWAYGHGWQRCPPPEERVPLPPFEPGRRGTWPRNVRKSFLHAMRPQGMTLYPGARGIMEANGPTLAWITGPAGAFTAKDHSFIPGQGVQKQVCVINDTRLPQEFALAWRATVDGRSVASGREKGRLAAAETLFVPLQFAIPPAIDGDKVDGEIELAASVGQHKHTDRFAFRVFEPIGPAKRTVHAVDPVGKTTAMLVRQGYTVRPWKGEGDARLVVIGRDALSAGQPMPSRLEEFVRTGGRALVFTQQPEWMRAYLGFRVGRYAARRAFPVDPRHHAVRGLDSADLRDWAGSSELVEPHPVYDFTPNTKRGGHGNPYWGWRWGNRGAVCSAPVEKPHLSSWRPILECEFDLAYTPLMELDYGRGRVVWCTLDLEEHSVTDPAADRLARRIVTYAATAALHPKASKVALMGGEKSQRLLMGLGLMFEQATRLPSDADLVIVGPDAECDERALALRVERGGKVLFLARAGEAAPLSVQLEEVAAFAGSLHVPDWPCCRGLSASDLRWRTTHHAWLVKRGGEVGADGLLARLRFGQGVAVVCQIDPGRFDTEKETFFRYTRWRQTRALAQIIANLGGTFDMDGRVFHPMTDAERRVSLAGTWQAALVTKLQPSPSIDRPHPDPGISELAKGLLAGTASGGRWATMALPTYWEQAKPGWGEVDGEAVFQKVVDVPGEWAGKDLILSLGPIDDFDDTFFNRVPVGRTDKATPKFYAVRRLYLVPGKLVKPGRNVVAVRVFDHFGSGGFGGNADQLYLELKPRPGTPTGLYHPDYRDDWAYGDDPYRYCRW